MQEAGYGQAGTVRSSQVGGRWHGPVYSNEREKVAMNNLNRKDARPPRGQCRDIHGKESKFERIEIHMVVRTVSPRCQLEVNLYT